MKAEYILNCSKIMKCNEIKNLGKKLFTILPCEYSPLSPLFSEL